MISVSEQKALLRKQMIAKRQSLSKKEWKNKSEQIVKIILSSSELENSNIIHCFISMNERFEVDTHGLVKKILDLGKTVVVPVTNFNDGTLSHSLLNSFDELTPNKWGVLEPKVLRPITIEKIDLVLVPLLAADRAGNRLGYGKGFYDRFLANIKASSFGLLFEEFVLEKIPTDSFDRKLNGLISEKGLSYS